MFGTVLVIAATVAACVGWGLLAQALIPGVGGILLSFAGGMATGHLAGIALSEVWPL
jgi:hypothetical protein